MHTTIVKINRRKHILFLYVLTNVVSTTVDDEMCTTDTGCPRPCAACDAGECFLTYNNRYDHNYKDLACFPILSCLSRSIKNDKPRVTSCNAPDGGKCDLIEDTHTASCVCERGYFGDTCQHKKKGIVTGIRSLTIKHVDYVNPCEEHNLTVVLIGKAMADFSGLEEITVTTNEGYYKKIVPTGQEKNMCFGGLMVCIEFEISDFKVSFKQYSHSLSSTSWIEAGQRYDTDGDLWFSAYLNEIGGVRRNIELKIRAIQNKLMYSSVSLDMFVNYGGFGSVVLKCVPSILKITNCERKYDNPLIYKRDTYIEMENEVIFLKNGQYDEETIEDKLCAGNAKLYWRVDSLYDTDHLLNPAKESYTETKISLNPFTLPFGVYRAYLEWTVVQECPVQNFAYCYFQVIEEPLVAVISGGSNRTVLSDQSLLLSAAESYDPNYRRSDPEQLLLKARWYCKRVPNVSTPDPLCQHWTKEMPISEPYLIQPGLLKPSTVYVFVLSVHSLASYAPEPQYTDVRVEVTSPGSDLFIECVQNCGNIVIPNQIIFMKAKNTNTSNYGDIMWFYYKTKYPVATYSAKSIMEKNLPPHILIVKEDALEMGTMYTFEVRVLTTGDYAWYSFETAILVYEGNCTVEPGRGIRGKTYFGIVCTKSETLLYEFYDKTVDEASEDIMFNGRMLGSSSDGKLLRVRLSRGTVVIYFIDSYGLSVNRTLQVELSFSDDNDLLEDLLRDLTDSHKRNAHVSNTLRLISLIADLIPSNVNRSVVLNKLGHVTYEVPVTNLQDDKLSISTMANFLVSLNRPTQVVINTNLMYKFQHLIRDQTEILKTNAKRTYKSRWMSPKEFKQVCRYILNCLYKVFQSRDITGANSEGFRLHSLVELKYCSLFMEKAIDNVKDALSFLQAPGQPPTTISIVKDSFYVWIMSNDDEEMPLNTILKNYEVIPVEISDVLQKVLNKNNKRGQYLSLQVVSIKENIFWWSKPGISSNLISTSLAALTLSEESLLRIKSLRPPLKMRFNITDFGLDRTIVNGRAMQLDSSLDPLYLDSHLVIYRIDLPPKSLSVLTFLFPQTNGSLHLSVSSNTRPEYKSIKESFVLITQKSPTYTTAYYNNREPIHLYVVILPSSEVSVNESVSYRFTINTKVCQSWKQGLWSSEDCKTSGRSTGKDAYCHCDHLSFFGVAVQKATVSTSINEVENPELFVTVIENPHVVSFIVTILVIYLLMSFFLRHRDNLDRKIQEIIVLEDNFPGDPYPYLIAVYTSPRYNAGTTAHVGFRLVGTAASSRDHVFRCSERKVLRRGCDDWFLMFTHDYLHGLTFLHLWHDNAGQNPPWYCNEIFVYDLTKSEQYQFVVGEWMALRTNCYPELVSTPLKGKDANEIKRMFSVNFNLGIRHSHMLLSIMYSHPRNQLSKFRRLTICMCGLMMSLLCSIMYYKDDDTNVGIDDLQYAITLKELLISLENILFCVIITFMALFLFKRTRKYQRTPKINTFKANLRLEKSLASKSMFLFRSIVFRKLNVSSECSNIQRIVSRALKSPPLAPVHLRDKRLFETRNHWLIIAWIFCALVIVICSSLVMLYGFKMGPVKSQRWLSTVLLTMGGYYFLFSPTKILIYSVFFAVSFQIVYEVNTYTISWDDIQLVQAQAEKIDLYEVFEKRNNWLYKPLLPDKRDKLLNKYKERLKWWLSIEFVLSVSFVVVTSAVVFKMWSAYYFNNHYILYAITKSVLPYMQYYNFFGVKSIYDLEVYLNSTFIYSIYSTRWYNNDLFDESNEYIFSYWLIDGKNRMIGRPRIRQLRVLPELVDIYVFPQFFRNPELSTSTEDTGVYSAFWQSGSWHHIRSNASAWKFIYPSGTVQTLFRLYGASKRLFHNGGYIAILGPRRIDTEHTLSDLSNNKWLDMRTRVVFAETTIYNVNYDLYTQVTLIVEYLASGEVLLKAQGTSLRDTVVVVAWDVAFLLYIVYYVVRSFLLVNEQGITQFTLGIKNVLRLMIIALSLAALAFLGLHIYTSTLYTTNFQEKNLDLYFDFDRCTVYFFKMKTILSFLFGVAILHLLFHLNFGRRFFIISYVLLVSLKWSFWMALILLLLNFNLRNIIYLLNISTANWAEDIMLSHHMMRQLNTEGPEIYNKFLLVIFPVNVRFIAKAGLFILFLNNVKLSKLRRFRKSAKFNIALFVFSKLKQRLKNEHTGKI